MRLSQEEKFNREAEKLERTFNRVRARFIKLAHGADVSFDTAGFVCLTYASGQVFKCRGPLADSVFGYAPKGEENEK
jgi:hypothetical protein